MSVATALCWASWGLSLATINPDSTSWIGFALFYASLGLALVGTGAIIGFIIRFIFLKHELVLRQVLDAFRQSFLFTILISASLMLLSQNLFSWLNLFFLMAALTVLELFLVSYRSGR